MSKLFRVFKYVKGYWGYAGLNIFFNILFSFFSIFSLTLIIPFMEVLFQPNDKAYVEILAKPFPSFSMSATYVKDAFYYYMAEYITSNGKAGALALICIVVLAMTFFKNLFRYLAMYFLAPIRNGVVRDLRNRMMAKVLELPLSYYSEERKGDIMSRMTTDVQEIEWSIMQTLEMMFREPLLIVISLVMLILISGYLTLYVFLLLPVAGLIVAVIGRSLKRSSVKGKEVLGSLFSIMEETLGGLKVIKAFTGENYVRKKFEDVNQQHFKLSVKIYRKADLASPISETIVVAILMLIMFIGGDMVLEAKTLLAASFIGYFAVASQIVTPIKQITTAYNNIQKGVASEERIEKVLHAEVTIRDEPGSKKVVAFNEEIVYKDLSFAYTKGDAGYVLKNINLVIPKGKTIALVGQSGSGKTTLADMLPRFYDASEGEILIDNVPVKNITLESLRGLMGVVSQESILFNDSIFNNIAFGLNNVSREDVMEAARIANAHEFIAAMPQAYDTNVGDRGGKLSGGQRQRISIARAILKNPPILILDEATSALDTESERVVQDALTKLMRNRTSIVIAHRLSTIIHADEIVVLNRGEIIERGPHEELLKKNGAYKRLFDMQSFK
jgi:subfamily B ATP-binding cassette protein MsbA